MRFAAALPVLLALCATAHADARGDAVLARARAVERDQLRALAGTTMQMQTRGIFRNGSTTHTVEARRELAIAPDGTIRNDWIWGKLDGQALGEAELRKASGAPPKPRGQAETLTVALAPLTARDVEVTPVGPLADGGYLLRCKVRRDAAVSSIDVVVDEATGKKRNATLSPAGHLVKLADRADMTLTYADDGTPAALRSDFAARFLWVDRAADLTTTRLR